MKGAGVRDTSRVLGISTNTVLAHLKTPPTDSKLFTARGWRGGAQFGTRFVCGQDIRTLLAMVR